MPRYDSVTGAAVCSEHSAGSLASDTLALTLRYVRHGPRPAKANSVIQLQRVAGNASSTGPPQ